MLFQNFKSVFWNSIAYSL
uniref:Uncharacterized protein n=1 Tax=Anguilla anguilla TaxID=7936 RepID=A0A0E9QYV0_ANGAN